MTVKQRVQAVTECSFCGMQQDEAQRRLLFIGPKDVAICSECAESMADTARREFDGTDSL